jgi:hypothetical protein
MQPKRIVVGGRAIVTVNDSVRLEFEVPPQEMSGDFIIVRNVAPALAQFQ